PRRDAADPRRDPVGCVRGRVDPREPGRPTAVQRAASPRRAAPDRGGRRAAAVDDAVDRRGPRPSAGRLGRLGLDAVEAVAAVVVGYLLGTIPTAVVVTRLATRGQVDIRQAGSGNPGGFNTFREVGKGWGAVVVLLDGGKAMLAGLLALVVVGD